MARLLTELRPRQAAVLLPSWWQLLAQEPSMLIEGYRLARDAGELLRLQLNAPPPAAWAAGVTDAASAAAASVDWPSGTSEAQGTGIVAQRSAGGYLCTYLAAMLEQVADVRALRENAQQQQQREWQQEQGRPEQQPLHQAHTDAAATDAAAAAAAPALYLNSVLERLGHKDGSVKPSTCSIAWMAAAGGLPAAGSTADRQQQLLASFAVYQWLPTLAKATEDALQGSVAAAERAARPLLQALLSTARQQQQQQQQQQPPPPELVLQCLAPLPVQQLAAAHGRQDIVDYLDAVAEGVREELLIEGGGCSGGYCYGRALSSLRRRGRQWWSQWQQQQYH
eukprot:XP_001692432.1 predicted protein [Chlamydomonas reinhardtii]